MKQSKKYTPGSGNYNPKMDYIWKKTITGPTWDIISGREKKVVKVKDNYDIINQNEKKKNRNKRITEVEKNNNKNTLTLDVIRSNKNDILSKRINNIFNKEYGISMIKQTQRGNLPISYDSRIRNDKPFQIKDNRKENYKEKINNNKYYFYNINDSYDHYVLIQSQYKSIKLNELLIFEKNFFICDLIISNFKNIKLYFNLIYKATIDGDKAQNFHNKVDGKNQLIILVKTSENIIIGGYTSYPWSSSNQFKYDQDFLFL